MQFYRECGNYSCGFYAPSESGCRRIRLASAVLLPAQQFFFLGSTHDLRQHSTAVVQFWSPDSSEAQVCLQLTNCTDKLGTYLLVRQIPGETLRCRDLLE